MGDEINRNAAGFCGVVVPAMASADASHSSHKCRWYVETDPSFLPFFPSQFDYQLVLINEWQLKKQALYFSCNQRNHTKDLLEKQSLQQEPVWATRIYSASSCQQEVSPTDVGLQLDFFALGMNTKSQGICNSF